MIFELLLCVVDINQVSLLRVTFFYRLLLEKNLLIFSFFLSVSKQPVNSMLVLKYEDCFIFDPLALHTGTMFALKIIGSCLKMAFFDHCAKAISL